jgi:hypothetical protein
LDGLGIVLGIIVWVCGEGDVVEVGRMVYMEEGGDDRRRSKRYSLCERTVVHKHDVVGKGIEPTTAQDCSGDKGEGEKEIFRRVTTASRHDA